MARGRLLSEIAGRGVALVAVPEGDEAAAIARYRGNPNVLHAERNHIRSVPEPAAHDGVAVVPGDTYFGQQWALHNTGQEFYCIAWVFGDLCLLQGTAGADIDAPEAWEISTGTPAIIVAVIDTGVDYTHPDLAPITPVATTSCPPISIRWTITGTAPTWRARLPPASAT